MKLILLSALLCPLLLLLPKGTSATLYQISLLTNAAVIPDDFPTDQIMSMLLSKFIAMVPNAVQVEAGDSVIDHSARKLQQEGEEVDINADAGRQLQILHLCPKNCENPRKWRTCIALGCACSCGGRRGLRQLQTDEDLTSVELKTIEKSLNTDANEVSSYYEGGDGEQQGFLAATSSIVLGVKIKVVS